MLCPDQDPVSHDGPQHVAGLLAEQLLGGLGQKDRPARGSLGSSDHTNLLDTGLRLKAAGFPTYYIYLKFRVYVLCQVQDRYWAGALGFKRASGLQ